MRQNTTGTKGQNYIGRGFSFDTSRSLDMLRRLQILDSIKETDISSYERSISKAVSKLPVVEAMKVMYDSWSSGSRNLEAAGIVGERARLDVDALVACLDEDLRQLRLARLRDLYDDPGHRLALGAMWFATSLEELQWAWSAVRQRHPTVGSIDDNLIDLMNLGFVTERTQPSAPMGMHADAEAAAGIRELLSGAGDEFDPRPLEAIWALRPLLQRAAVKQGGEIPKPALLT
jgi:hypothetical protein